MKRMVAVALILLGVFNFLTLGLDSEAHHEGSDKCSTIVMPSVAQEVAVELISGSTHNCNTENCTNGPHDCHFGHCSFLLSQGSPATVVLAENHFFALGTSVIPLSPKDNFRPPRS